MRTVFAGALARHPERTLLIVVAAAGLLFKLSQANPTSGNTSAFALLAPTALNDKGSIIGLDRAATDALHPFQMQADTRAALALPALAAWGQPNAINSSGRIAGYFSRKNDQTKHACLWQQGRLIALDDDNALQSEARALNVHGDMAGFWRDAHNGFHAGIWRNGARQEIPKMRNAQIYPSGLSAQGQIVGVGTAADGSHAYAWRQGRLMDLGLGCHAALNDRDQIAGDRQLPDGSFHACLWTQGKPRDLGLLPNTNDSRALALNDAGQVVGRASWIATGGSGDGTPRAFLWSRGTLLDLQTVLPPSASLKLEEAIAINNQGQILGNARRGVVPLAVLLTPQGGEWLVRVL